MDMAVLAKKIEELEQTVQRLQDRNDISNLISRFATMWSQKNMHRISEFYALEMPDVCVEPSDAGVLVGAEKIRELYEKTFHLDHYEGNMLRHNFTNEAIEVAEDGKSAKGLWWTIGFQSVKKDGELVPIWCFSQWANDFIKLDGVWKIWHQHCYQMVKCDARKLWTEDYKDWTSHLQSGVNACNNAMIEKKEKEGLRTTYYNPWTPTAIQEAFPACPKPYKTWTPGEEDWMFANAPELKGFIAKL